MMFTCSAEKLVLIVTISTVICSVTEVLAGENAALTTDLMTLTLPEWKCTSLLEDNEMARRMGRMHLPLVNVSNCENRKSQWKNKIVF